MIQKKTTEQLRLEGIERAKAWYQANKDRKKQYDKEYYKANREKRDLQTRLWNEKNRDKRLAVCKKDREKYPYRYHAHSAPRRFRKVQAMPNWLTPEHKNQIIEFYKNRPENHHVDHIIPLKGKIVSGLHVPWNLQYLPAIENLQKGRKCA